MTFKTFYGIITAALKKEIFMKLFSRENYLKKIRGFYHEDDIIKVITGVRRCGKSSLMHTIADELKNSGVPDENFLPQIDVTNPIDSNILTASVRHV